MWALLLAVLCAALCGCRREPEFFAYKSARHPFRVDLPESLKGKVSYAEQALDTPAGSVRQGVYTAQSQKQVFEVRVLEIPAEFTADQAADAALRFRGENPEKQGGAVFMNGRRIIDGLNARTMRARLGSGRFEESAVVSVGRALYRLSVAAARESGLDGPGPRRFFGSFEFLDSPGAGRASSQGSNAAQSRAGDFEDPYEEPDGVLRPAPSPWYILDRPDLGFRAELPQALRNTSEEDLVLDIGGGRAMQGRAVRAGGPDLQFSAAVFADSLNTGESAKDVLLRIRNFISTHTQQVFYEKLDVDSAVPSLDITHAMPLDGPSEYVRIKAVIQGRTLFLATCSSPDKDLFESPGVPHFFDTFTVIQDGGPEQ